MVVVDRLSKMAYFIPLRFGQGETDIIIVVKFLFDYVEIWCQTLYLFHRLEELTLIVPCYFGHSSVNLRYKIAL